MAQLANAVHLTDPDSHETVILQPGTCPEDRLAALVTNPSAWIDGELPPAAKAITTADGPDGASGDDSDTSDAGNQAPAAKKTAAAKRAATKPARGRDAAEQGTSGE